MFSFPHPGSCPKLSFLYIQVVGFPRLESEDYAMPWFCPKPSFLYIQVVGFPRLESEDYAMPWFCPKPSFLYKLGPWLAFSSRGISSSAKPLELNYTVNVTKRLVYSIRGAFSF